MLSKGVYDKVLSDISQTASIDDRIFTQVMGKGNDSIDAGAGGDWVMGGYGNDTITGGIGNDTMWGRGGGNHIVNLGLTNGTSTTTENTDVYFTDGLKIGESITIGGLTLTAVTAMTVSHVIAAFENLAQGATTGNTVTGVTYNASGSLANWSSGAAAQSSSFNSFAIKFTSTTPTTNVTDLTASYKLLDNDTFVWNANDAGTTGATDVIKDFSAWNGTEGDKLNITSLLAGYSSTTSTLSQWVSVATGQTAPNGTANSTKITIDIDGTGPGLITQTIWLEGVTLASTDPAVLKFNSTTNNGILIA